MESVTWYEITALTRFGELVYVKMLAQQYFADICIPFQAMLSCLREADINCHTQFLWPSSSSNRAATQRCLQLQPFTAQWYAHHIMLQLGSISSVNPGTAGHRHCAWSLRHSAEAELLAEAPQTMLLGRAGTDGPDLGRRRPLSAAGPHPTP